MSPIAFKFSQALAISHGVQVANLLAIVWLTVVRDVNKGIGIMCDEQLASGYSRKLDLFPCCELFAF